MLLLHIGVARILSAGVHFFTTQQKFLKIDSCSGWGVHLVSCGGALTHFPCKLGLKKNFSTALGGAGAPTAPPGYAYGRRSRSQLTHRRSAGVTHRSGDHQTTALSTSHGTHSLHCDTVSEPERRQRRSTPNDDVAKRQNEQVHHRKSRDRSVICSAKYLFG